MFYLVPRFTLFRKHVSFEYCKIKMKTKENPDK